jgi:dihydropteroate synthase
MHEAGATFIDIGGESTKPGASIVSLEEEMNRVLPLVELIHNNIDVIISLDTSSPEVMLQGANAGAGLINDVRALQKPGAVEAACKTNLPL